MTINAACGKPRRRMVDRGCGLIVAPVTPETVGRGACKAKVGMTHPARRVPVLAPERKHGGIMIECEDRIQLCPGVAAMTVRAPEKERAMGRVLGGGKSRRQRDQQDHSQDQE